MKNPYVDRIKNLQSNFQRFSSDSCVVDNATDLYYLTGLKLSAGKLLVQKEQACLFVDGRYLELCQKQSPVPVVLSENEAFKKHLLSAAPFLQKIAFDSTTTSYQTFVQLQQLTTEIGKERKESPHLVPIEGLLKPLRVIKDANEIALLKEAALLGCRGFDFVRSLIKEGMTEVELSVELEIFWRRQDGEKLAFEPIIAFGPNSSIPHHRAGETKLKQNQPVLIDIGVIYRHYHSDMSRTLFFGEPNPKLADIYNIVHDAQQAALELCKPGILVGDLDDAARALITQAGYGENFNHSLGHGIGLEIHEFPSIKNIPSMQGIRLQAGMAITIEPGIYLPGLGGVRIEDTIIITETGYENLTPRSKELQVL